LLRLKLVRVESIPDTIGQVLEGEGQERIGKKKGRGEGKRKGKGRERKMKRRGGGEGGREKEEEEGATLLPSLFGHLSLSPSLPPSPSLPSFS
jgi:hypothetical protein